MHLRLPNEPHILMHLMTHGFRHLISNFVVLYFDDTFLYHKPFDDFMHMSTFDGITTTSHLHASHHKVILLLDHEPNAFGCPRIIYFYAMKHFLVTSYAKHDDDACCMNHT
jgi:hypothetical protein